MIGMKPVLIVEDEPIMRESLRDWLVDDGYQVRTVEDGEQALKVIGEQDFGVVVLDLRLPGKDGLEVLREATAQRPHLKGIIITAYPSVETAVEAMKLGAIDYLSKPFAPDALERLIQQTLGPVQVEIRPKVVEEAAVEEAIAEEAKVEEIITIAEEEVPAHLQQGKDHFKESHYQQALKEFKAILEVAPGNLEARVWTQKAKTELGKPRIEAEGEAAVTEEAVKPKECLWMRMGMVSYRLCTRDYDCLGCEFDQTMQEKWLLGKLQRSLRRWRDLRVCQGTRGCAAMPSRVMSRIGYALASSSVSLASLVK